MNEWMSSFRQSKSQEKWKAIARREVGTSHEATKTPCQDYADYKQYGDYLIGVVADGAGSRRYSEHGSRLAVEATLRYFVEILEGLRGKSLFTSQNDAEYRFHNLIDQVRTELGTKAGNFSREYKEKISADQFACTLLVFVVFPEGIAAMQLGDGFIVVRDYKSQEYDLLFSPSKGEYVNETTFVTSSRNDIKQDLQIIYRPNPVSFICASTDGLEKVALDLANNKAFPRFFIPLEKYIQNTHELEQDSYITDFLKSEQVNRKTDDDKTILLCSSVKSDSVSEINITVQESGIPISLPTSTTLPPSVVHSKNLVPPSGRRAPRISNEDTETASELTPTKVESKNISQGKQNKNNQADAISILLISNSLMFFFAALYGSILIRDNSSNSIIFILLGLLLCSIFFGLFGLYVSEIKDHRRISRNKIFALSLPIFAVFLAVLLIYFGVDKTFDKKEDISTNVNNKSRNNIYESAKQTVCSSFPFLENIPICKKQS